MNPDLSVNINTVINYKWDRWHLENQKAIENTDIAFVAVAYSCEIILLYADVT